MNDQLDWLISVDDHVIEPAHTWQSRIAAKDRDRAPRAVNDHEGTWWLYDDKRIPILNVSAVAGKSDEEKKAPPAPTTYDDMRPGCYDPGERVKDMDEAGVLAPLPFPSFPRFCGQQFYEAADRDLALRCVQAYNDFIIDEWAGAAPGRFIPLIIMPLWDPRLAVVEIERCAAKGAKAIAFSENPTPLGLPSIHDEGRYWDPVFQTASDTGMPLCTHLGSSSRLPTTSPDCPTSVTYALATLNLMTTCVDWLFSDNFIRFPDLKLCLSEGGISWIPAAIERCEEVIEEQGDWIRNPDWPPPRELFRDHVFGCTIRDQVGVKLLDDIGVRNVMVETDYPHGATSWPTSIELAKNTFGHLPDADLYNILQGNARRVFNFEPAEPPVRATPSLSAATF